MIFEFLILILVLSLLFKASRRPKNFPPGPTGLPLVGYIPFVGNQHDSVPPHIAMEVLCAKYGAVTGFFLGPTQPFISVCGYEAVKEALNNEELNGRPNNAARKERTFGKRLGIMFTEGDFFREQRRFTLRHLRDLGFGRTSSENLIQEEIYDLIEETRMIANSNPDRVVDFKAMFNLTLINILWALIGGERFKHDDAQLKHLLSIVDKFFRSGEVVRANIPVPGFVIRNFPFARKFVGLRNDMFEPLQNFIQTAIEEHEKVPSADGSPRDFIDVYLDELHKQEGINSMSTFQKDQLIAVITDLFIAGGETTGNAIGYALLYMLHYPEIQRKVQDELDRVCGDSIPSLIHRPSLPYTEAVLMEVLRLANITPFTIPHIATKDTQLQGYTIPKGSVVSMNIHSVHLDDKYWTDPEVFRPERHLNENGTAVVKTDHLLAFGAGKRMCLGESLARNSFFLFTSAFLKSFQFQAVPNRPLPTLEPKVGFTLGYEGFEAILKPNIR